MAFSVFLLSIFTVNVVIITIIRYCFRQREFEIKLKVSLHLVLIYNPGLQYLGFAIQVSRHLIFLAYKFTKAMPGITKPYQRDMPFINK